VLQYSEIAREFESTIQKLFWDEELGSYFDYDILNGRLVKEFYASIFFPLWAGVDTSNTTVSRMIRYLTSEKVFDFPGGIPTSLYNTGKYFWNSSMEIFL